MVWVGKVPVLKGRVPMVWVENVAVEMDWVRMRWVERVVVVRGKVRMVRVGLGWVVGDRGDAGEGRIGEGRVGEGRVEGVEVDPRCVRQGLLGQGWVNGRRGRRVEGVEVDRRRGRWWWRRWLLGDRLLGDRLLGVRYLDAGGTIRRGGRHRGSRYRSRRGARRHRREGAAVTDLNAVLIGLEESAVLVGPPGEPGLGGGDDGLRPPGRVRGWRCQRPTTLVGFVSLGCLV